MQQHLPFTVLKLGSLPFQPTSLSVATALTVYGIETDDASLVSEPKNGVATALTVYGIETRIHQQSHLNPFRCNSTYRLRY